MKPEKPRAAKKRTRPLPADDVSVLSDIYQRLYADFGPQQWWPAETPIEMIVGAVLTQNTAWTNVEKAILVLKRQEVLTLPALRRIPEKALAHLIRPSGYFNVKSRRLKAVVSFIFEAYGGHLDRMFSADPADLRTALLDVKGLGPETVDSILLYAGGFPFFVVDAYTRRILLRHQLIEEKWSYHEIQKEFMDHLPEDATLFNEYHALIVKTAKVYCKKNPDCLRCPLNTLPGFSPPF